MDRRRFLGAAAAGVLMPLLGGCGDEPVEADAPLMPAELAFGRLFETGEDRLADFAGRPLLINFWATWCAPCRYEMPSLERLAIRLSARGALLIGVSVDSKPFPVREYLRGQGLTFARHIDPERDAARTLGIADYPTTLAVDAAGRFKGRMIGAADWEDPAMLSTIGRLLGIRAV